MLRHKDFQFYLVSEFGEVYSNKTQKFLKHRSNGKGYSKVKLTQNLGGQVDKYVHRLVAEIYVPNPDNKPEVNHIDGDTLNNHYSNLEWVTRKENMSHANKLGKYNRKLTYEDRQRMIELCREGRNKGVVAAMFGVSVRHVERLWERNK